MKIRILFISILLLFLFSCKKEAVVLSCESPTNNSYYPMTVGSYWIYQWYEIDTLGNETVISDWIDTVRIVKDTLIGNFAYAQIKESYLLTGQSANFSYRRDSLGYLVDPNNTIYFSSNNFIDTLNTVFVSGAFESFYKMELGSSPIVTPAGTFDCLNFQGTVNPFLQVSWSERYLNFYYAKGVGKIQENNFYFSQLTEFERRLVEYHIE